MITEYVGRMEGIGEDKRLIRFLPKARRVTELTANYGFLTGSYYDITINPIQNIVVPSNICLVINIKYISIQKKITRLFAYVHFLLYLCSGNSILRILYKS